MPAQKEQGGERKIREPVQEDSSTALAGRLERADRILLGLFGKPDTPQRDPVEELIITILSQNTNDRNRDAAYRQLKVSYPSWEQVLVADLDSLEAVIRPAGLGRQKALHIKETLAWLMDSFGGFDLAVISKMSDDEAIDLLTSRSGIGIKTACVVLAFAFGRNLCPVDTHVHRIAHRLGWVPERSSAGRTFHHLRPAMPPDRAARFHLNLLRFGRAICHSRSPACAQCPLWDECVFDAKGKRED
ncbi:MAG: endonuclease III [Calditrichaeota bacterium]|nr:endonuclease III [Calditrichota bacterium]